MLLRKDFSTVQASSVPHLGLEEVKELVAAAGDAARNLIAKERDWPSFPWSSLVPLLKDPAI